MAENRPSIKMLPVAAMLAAAAGIIAFAVVALRVRGRWRIASQYAGYSARLADMEKAAERGAAAVRLFQELPDPRPVPVADLVRESLQGQKYDSFEQPQRETTVPGWALRQVEITFPEIELPRLAAFMARAEAQRPPWRVTAMTIRSLAQSGGIGHARLTLESLEKIDQ